MAARAASLALAAVAAAGCAGGGEEPPRSAVDGAVLYTIGVSTDPYGESQPSGFGVARGVAAGDVTMVEVRGRYGWFGGAEWLLGRRILVHRAAPPLRRPLLYNYRTGRLERVGEAPFRSGTRYAWSPDGRRLALEPPEPCNAGQRSLFRCWRSSASVFLSRADGSRRRKVADGTLGGWTPEGRLVVVGDRPGPRWRNGHPIWSADGRLVAYRGNGGAVVIARRGGRVLQRITSPYVISMFAWSPRGTRLAYTTSGFPDPHELFVVDRPAARPRRFFEARPHFDWITWSPDGRLLLLDADKARGWRLFSADDGRQVGVFRRLGGRPLWCCPVNAFSALAG